jgi:ribokinase
MDIVNRVDTHPSPGETINSTATIYNPGGKGANQAVAASLAGANVKMIAAVGTDIFSKELTSTLSNYEVDTKAVINKEGASGMAFITVNHKGENTIVLSKGANGKLVQNDVQLYSDLFDQAKIILLQNEIPWETTRYAMELAKQTETIVFYNPAPAEEIPKEVLSFIDWLILNESEAEVITGHLVKDDSSAVQAAKILVERGVRRVVLTLGSRGSIYLDGSNKMIRVPAFSVTPIDTTAAGDTFIGSLAASVMEDHDVQKALEFASASAAITVTRNGAQNSIPNRDEIEQFIKKHSSNV